MSVEFLGVAYFFYMAWNILRDGGALNVSGDGVVVTFFCRYIRLLGVKLALSER